MQALLDLLVLVPLTLLQLTLNGPEEINPQTTSSSSDAQFVWADSQPNQRLQVAYFRYAVDLETLPEAADISIFASSRYHLFVNGQFVSFGPARSYPQHPEFDPFGLLPYLEVGRNVVLVKVMSNGTDTYQLRRSPATFIAWGDLKLPDGTTRSLSTPGDWTCRIDKGYASDSPKVSFALGPMEVYDARLEDENWLSLDTNPSGWATPLVQPRQGYWGELRPRSIPFLTQEVIRPQALLGAYRLSTTEQVYSFRVKVPDQSREEFHAGKVLFGYTFIYSPKLQQVPIGLWWGEHFLNGQGPLDQAESTRIPHRQEATLNLRQGWNPFFVKRTSFWGTWDFYLAVPKEANLALSPSRVMDDAVFFLTAGPFAEQQEAELGALPVPFDPARLPPSLDGRWNPQKRSPSGVNPAIDMAWKTLGMPLPIPSDQTQEIELKVQGDHALIYDFRYKRLGRIAFDVTAPKGTVLDIGFSEDLFGDRPWLMKRVGLYMAARLISPGNPIRFETFKPYGLRYLQLNVLEAPGSVRISNIRLIEQVYPFQRTGEFECSDPLLNAIWELGWRTLRVCAEDSYTDTPFRERGLYAGDMLPEMAITLAGTHDLRLVKRSLRLFQDMYADVFFPGTPRHPDEIDLLEDYPLLTLEALGWYLDRTGDLEFVREVYPAYHNLLTRLASKRGLRGLVHTERVFIEWTEIEKRDLESTAYNALLARSFSTLARIAHHLDLDDDASSLEQSGKQLEQALLDHLWDPVRGAFLDGIKGESPLPFSYPISTALPLLFGITDATIEPRIAAFLRNELREIGNTDRKRKTTPYGSYYILGALYRAGLAGLAEEFMRKHWGPMVLRHNDTAWENFGDTGIGTLSHAWSGTPTYYLTTQVLGVDLGFPEPFNPDSLIISPASETLDWARGSVPHPKGMIRISWRLTEKQLEVTCSVPEGIDWEVKPKGRLSQFPLIVNGSPPQQKALKESAPSS